MQEAVVESGAQPAWEKRLCRQLGRSMIQNATRTGLAWALLLAAISIVLYFIARTSSDLVSFLNVFSGSWPYVLLGGLWATVVSALFWPIVRRLNHGILSKRAANPHSRLIMRRLGLWLGHKTLGVLALWLTFGLTLTDIQSPGHISPETQAWLNTAEPRVPEKGNAYYTALSFKAPDDADADALGRKTVALLKDKARSGESLRNDQPVFPKRDLHKVNQWRCDSEPGCLRKTLARRGEIEAELKAHAGLLARYDAMLRMPHFQEELYAHWEWPIVSADAILSMSRLKSLGFVLDVADGRSDPAMRSMLAEMKTYKQWFAEPNQMMIAKMSIASALSNKAVTLAQVLNWKPELARRWEAELAEMLNAESLLRADVAQVQEFEFVSSANTARLDKVAFVRNLLDGYGNDADESKADSVALLLRSGNMVSRIHGLQQELVSVCRMDPRDYKKAGELWADILAKERAKFVGGEGLGSIARFPENLMITKLIGDYDLVSFCTRLRQPVAALRAATLQARTLARGRTYLEQHLIDPAYAHPNTGKAPLFDAKAGTLSVEVLGRSDGKPLVLPLNI